MTHLFTVPYQPKTARDLLRDLGVGHYNITMMIETLFMAPATTEAASAPVMLLVGRIQNVLNSMGTNLVITGTLDAPTNQALEAVAGKDYLIRSWFDVVRDVVAAKMSGHQIRRPAVRRAPAEKAVGAFDLPDVPGGTITYVAGGLLLWHLLSKKKRTSP